MDRLAASRASFIYILSLDFLDNKAYSERDWNNSRPTQFGGVCDRTANELPVIAWGATGAAADVAGSRSTLRQSPPGIEAINIVCSSIIRLSTDFDDRYRNLRRRPEDDTSDRRRSVSGDGLVPALTNAGRLDYSGVELGKRPLHVPLIKISSGYFHNCHYHLRKVHSFFPTAPPRWQYNIKNIQDSIKLGVSVDYNSTPMLKLGEEIRQEIYKIKGQRPIVFGGKYNKNTTNKLEIIPS